jgi:hypothetical protein
LTLLYDRSEYWEEVSICIPKHSEEVHKKDNCKVSRLSIFVFAAHPVLSIGIGTARYACMLKKRLIKNIVPVEGLDRSKGD